MLQNHTLVYQNGVSESLCFRLVVCTWISNKNEIIIKEEHKTSTLLHSPLASYTQSYTHLSTRHMENTIPKDHRLKMVILEQTEATGLT